MSIATKFENFVKELRTTNHATVKMRNEAITKRLNQDFWNSDSSTAHSKYVGSYGRGTAIKGFSDVDFLMQLPYETYKKYNEYKGNGQSALLQAVKSSIEKTYSTTKLRGDGQVVVVNFFDGMQFEVVPAFVNKDGISYTYPDTNSGGSWKAMNPVAEINAINICNNTYNKKVKHLVRMMKAWKKKNNVDMKGILIEALVQNFMPLWGYNDKSYFYYDFMTRDFLKYLSEQDEKQEYWLIKGSNRRVYRTGVFEKKAKASYVDALTAINYEIDQKSNLANIYWQKIYGSYFKG